MSLVYKNESTSNQNFVAGPTIDYSMISDHTSSIYNGYFLFSNPLQAKISMSTAIYDLFNVNRTICNNIIAGSLSQTYDLFYQHNGVTDPLLDKYLRVSIVNSDLIISLYPIINKTFSDFITTADLNLSTSFCITIEKTAIPGGFQYEILVRKNSEPIRQYTYETATDWDLTSIDGDRFIGFNIGLNNTYYSKDIVLYSDILSTTEIQNYNAIGYLPSSKAEIIYTMPFQNFTTTVINSGTEGTDGDGTLSITSPTGEEFYINIATEIVEKSIHKMFDGDAYKNILSTENITNDIEIYSTTNVNNCEFLAQQMTEIINEAEISANSIENKSFGYVISDENFSQYMTCGKLDYGITGAPNVYCLFLPRGIYSASNGPGYCTQLLFGTNWSTYLNYFNNEYGHSPYDNLWMNNFKRKWLGFEATTNWVSISVTDNTSVGTTSAPWGYDYKDVIVNSSSDYDIFLENLRRKTSYLYRKNIFYNADGASTPWNYIDYISENNTNMNLSIINNSPTTFRTVGAVTSSASAYVHENSEKNSSWYMKRNNYKKLDDGGMIVPSGDYMATFNHTQSLSKPTASNTWDKLNLRLKKILTTGYYILKVNSTNNQFTVHDSYINFEHDDEIELLPTEQFGIDTNTSYKYFNIPDVDGYFYVFIPLYSNIIAVNSTATFPISAQVYDPQRYVKFFSSITPTAGGLYPKTLCKYTIKKIGVSS